MARLVMTASPIGDILEDFSISVLRELEKGATAVFLEADDGFAKRARAKKIIRDRHTVHYLDDPNRLDLVRGYLSKGEDVILMASSGVPCFADPGFQVVDMVIREFPETEFVLLGLASALEAGTMLAGVETSQFQMLGLYPEHYREPVVKDLPTVYFVRGEHVRAFVEQANAWGPYARMVLARDVRKRGRQQIWFLHGREAAPEDLEDQFADFVGVLVPRIHHG